MRLVISQADGVTVSLWQRKTKPLLCSFEVEALPRRCYGNMNLGNRTGRKQFPVSKLLDTPSRMEAHWL
jgi:hypothetical protein